MDRYYIGIDNGGTSCKAVIFDGNGQEICSSGRLLEMLTPAPNQTERDMDQLWEMNIECIRDVIERSEIDPGLIRGIGCSGHGKGLYLVDKNGRPLRNGIVSTDGRAQSYVSGWYEDGTAERVFETNYQSILACQPVSLLRWLKDHEEDTYHKIHWVFEVKDYIRFLLTGEAYGEITDYSGSNLLDLSIQNYSKDLLELYGIPEIYKALPPLKGSTDICGYITKEVSDRTFLPEGIPVAGGMFDIDACSIAMNIVDSDYLCVIAGTWSINEYISKDPVLDHSIMMNSCYCCDDFYLIEECSPTSAGNLEWYIQMFLQKEVADCAARGENIYHYCDKLVSSLTPDEQEIIFLPYIYGSNYNPEAKATLFGLDSHHTQAHIIRAVFEGIVFCHMVHIEKLLAKNDSFKAVRLAGGAANSKVWTQMFADVIGLPVEIVDVPELGTLGVAMAAAVVCGDYKNLNEASSAMSCIGKRINPSDESELYKAKFQRYKRLSESLNQFWT